MVTLTCNNPETALGANPSNCTSAATPPICTPIGITGRYAADLLMLPVVEGGEVRPAPVAKSWITVPRAV